MKLTELFDRTADWKWLSPNENPFSMFMPRAAGFTINDIFYMVGMGPYPALPDPFNDAWMMGFAANIDGEWEENEVGTSGNEFLVFSTIMDVVGTFLQENSPDALILGAKPERERIYQSLVRRKARDLENIGYVPHGREEATVPMYGHVVLLPLVRKDLLD